MKQQNNFAHISRRLILFGFILFVFCSATWAQSNRVFPRVCVELNNQKGTVRLAANAAAGSSTITVDAPVPLSSVLMINRGGTNQESGNFYVSGISGSSSPYTLTLKQANLGSDTTYSLAHAHNANETIEFDQQEIEAHFGYHNPTNAQITIPRSITSFNFFTPGSTSYTGQPSQFLPGIYENVFTVRLPSQLRPEITWVLDRNVVSVSANTPACAAVTYQGRLTDAGAAANGVYDFQFTAYDALIGGTAQSQQIIVEDISVTSGIFTAQLNFYSSLTSTTNFLESNVGNSFKPNLNAKFLEIAVRAGNSTGAFTTLAPRQPFARTPYAVNAANALLADSIIGGTIQLRLTNGAPDPAECTRERFGEVRFDSQNSRLWICGQATGGPPAWRSVVLQ